MSAKARGEMVEKFRTEKYKHAIMLVTFDLGAEGLNLQTCSTIIVLDHWWNQSKTRQALGRVLRQGQLSEFVKMYLLTSNTGIEKAIFLKQSIKSDILEDYKTGSSEKKMTKMTTNDIIRIIELGDNEKLLRGMKY